MSEYRQVAVVDPVSREVLLELDRPRGVFRRMRGLIGKDRLSPGGGVALRTKQIHTFGMRLSIDAVYVSRRGEILKISTLAPGSLGPFVPRARWVLEVGAGEAKRLGLAEGRRLVVEPRSS